MRVYVCLLAWTMDYRAWGSWIGNVHTALFLMNPVIYLKADSPLLDNAHVRSRRWPSAGQPAGRCSILHPCIDYLWSGSSSYRSRVISVLKDVKTIYCAEFFRVLSSIQWSPTELLWVVRGMQQRPTDFSLVKTQVGVISLDPRLLDEQISPWHKWFQHRN